MSKKKVFEIQVSKDTAVPEELKKHLKVDVVKRGLLRTTIPEVVRWLQSLGHKINNVLDYIDDGEDNDSKPELLEIAVDTVKDVVETAIEVGKEAIETALVIDLDEDENKNAIPDDLEEKMKTVLEDLKLKVDTFGKIRKELEENISVLFEKIRTIEEQIEVFDPKEFPEKVKKLIDEQLLMNYLNDLPERFSTFEHEFIKKVGDLEQKIIEFEEWKKIHQNKEHMPIDTTAIESLKAELSGFKLQTNKRLKIVEEKLMMLEELLKKKLEEEREQSSNAENTQSSDIQEQIEEEQEKQEQTKEQLEVDISEEEINEIDDELIEKVKEISEGG